MPGALRTKHRVELSSEPASELQQEQLQAELQKAQIRIYTCSTKITSMYLYRDLTVLCNSRTRKPNGSAHGPNDFKQDLEVQESSPTVLAHSRDGSHPALVYLAGRRRGGWLVNGIV